jgi:acyl carrier protein
MPVTQSVDIESVKSGLKSLIVERLKLEVDPASIEDGAPLFAGGEGSPEPGQGLALDSVEALEIVVGIEEKWGVVIEDDSVANEFYSIETLSGLVKRLLDAPVVEAASA